MIVRVSVFCFVILTASLTSVIAQDEEISPRIRVMTFYKWYLHWTNEKHDLTKNKVAMENYFSAQFNGRIYSQEGQSAGRNLFVDGQQWSDAWAKNIKVGEAAITGDKASINVILNAPPDGPVKTMQISLVREGGDWKIDRISSIEMDKVAAPANTAAAAPAGANNTSASAPATIDASGNIVIPEPTRQLTVADLVGAWGENPGRISTQYVSSYTGNYAGTDSLHFTSTFTIDADGRYVNKFFEVRNKQKLSDVSTGTVTIAGRLITIKEKGTTKYVIRGWLELPDITILKVAGPWFDDQPIEERYFTDFGPDMDYSLAGKWVRKK